MSDDLNRASEQAAEARELYLSGSAEAGAPVPGPVSYRIDSTRVSFVEYWWGTRSPLVVLAWLLVKCFRVRVPGSTDDPAVESLGDFEVSPDDLPAQVQQRFAAFSQDLAGLGFHSPVYHAIDDVLQSTRTYLASFAHPTLPVVARLHNRVWSYQTPAKDLLFTEFVTAFSHGEYLWTLSSKADMLAPSLCRVARREGAAPLELWKLHEQERNARQSGRTALPASTREQVLEVCDRLHTAVRDFHLRRGVFAPLTPADRERCAATREAHRKASAHSAKYPEILAEVDRLQQPQAGGRGAILILVVSMLLFFGVGIPGLSYWRVLALVPILLFHECGHYVAMRASGYRNLRMFFIPGLGAAVSGRNFNVPGWKKVVVSLMGPLPGILVGVVLGLCGLIWRKPVALEVATLALILNGLNLVPILPMDGGHIVHTVLFSRHYLLDILFRIGAAIALIGLAVLTSDRLLLLLAIVMFIGLPAALRMERAARELRREGMVPASPDNRTIPPAVAEQIIDKLKAGTRKPQSNKITAQRVLHVFETLNTKPPGWMASIGFMSVHIMSFLAAAIFALIFVVVQQRGSDWDNVLASAHSPRHSLTAAAIRNSPTRHVAAMAPAAPNTIVATFARTSQATAAYDNVVPRLQSGETATLLGDSLFIRLPATDGAVRLYWIAELQPRAADVFVDGGTMRATFRFSGLARDEAAARAIADELDQYFRLPLSEGLIAPWSPSKALTPDQRLARKTYLALYEKLTPEKLYKSAARELAPCLGQAWLADGTADPAGDTTWAREGYALRTGLLIEIDCVSFHDAARGASAIIAWLDAKGCRALRYDVVGEPVESDSEDEPLDDNQDPPN